MKEARRAEVASLPSSLRCPGAVLALLTAAAFPVPGAAAGLRLVGGVTGGSAKSSVAAANSGHAAKSSAGLRRHRHVVVAGGMAPGPAPVPSPAFAPSPATAPVGLVNPSQLPSISVSFGIANMAYHGLVETVGGRSNCGHDHAGLSYLNLDRSRTMLNQGGRDYGESCETALKGAVVVAIKHVLTEGGMGESTTAPPNASQPASFINVSTGNVSAGSVSAGNASGDEASSETDLPVKIQVSVEPSRSPPSGASLTQTLAAAALPRRARVGVASLSIGVNIVNHPVGSLDHLTQVLSILSEASEEGTLATALYIALEDALGVEPELRTISVAESRIALWNATACAGHLRKLVRRFSSSYTREQVPYALSQECTNWAARVSFTDDMVINSEDRAKCQAATKKFVRIWDYGKGKVDYSDFCKELCQMKYGEGAIQCINATPED